MARELGELKWIEDILPDEEVSRKPMFGGFAYYYTGKIVLVIFESEGDYSYKNKKYNFEIWNGVMFPVEREYHPMVAREWPQLVNHPVLSKWFYLPAKSEDFEELLPMIIKKIFRPDSVWGTTPSKNKKSKVVKVKYDPKMDMTKPFMFRDELPSQRIEAAKKISDLKNIGPVSEKELHQAGIKTVPQFVKMGWKSAMEKLVRLNKKNLHTLFAFAIYGALANKEWNGLNESEKQEIKEFMQKLRTKSVQKSKGQGSVSKKAKKQKRS